MKNIHMTSYIDFKELLKGYDLSKDSVVNIQIGYDERVYILLNSHIPERIQGMFVNTKANAKYSVIRLSVDWEMGEVVHHELLELGHHSMNFHFIQPIGEHILLLGARCMYYEKPGPEKNAVIADEMGNVVKKFCLGDGIQDCIVTDSGDIITSYFDEGVFGNFGWEQPIGSSGLIVWSQNGEIKWQADSNICDCYALNIDEKNHIWYYYYTDFNLVKTDLKREVVYKPGRQSEGFGLFLISKDGRTVIHDGGYSKHFDFFAETVVGEQLNNYEGVHFVYDGKKIRGKMYSFRSSKAVLLDSHDRLFVKDVITVGVFCGV